LNILSLQVEVQVDHQASEHSAQLEAAVAVQVVIEQALDFL
jgi:hypothetical protein